MTVSLRRLTAPEFHLLTPELVDIYIDAMGYDPAIRSGRIAVWRQECRLAGFTSVIATERTDRGEFITGLAYGFSGTPRVWWHHQVMRGLKPRGLEDLGRDYFELAEIHVDPADTITDARFFSHRREGTTGRQAGLVWCERGSEDDRD